MKQSICLLITILACFQITAQSSFSITPDLVIAEKPSNLFVFYNYAQLENLTEDSMEVKWEKIEVTTSLGGSELGAWEIAITDPENSYTGDLRESATFNLGTEVLSTDKFIFQLFPNNQAGWMLAKYKFYPVLNPQDSVIVTFDYTATDSTTPTFEAGQMIQLEIAPNPANRLCRISNLTNDAVTCEVFDINGRSMAEFSVIANGSRGLNVADFENGFYFLQSERDGALSVQRFVVCH